MLEPRGERLPGSKTTGSRTRNRSSGGDVAAVFDITVAYELYLKILN